MKTWRWTLLFVASGAMAFACTVEDKDKSSGTSESVTTSSTGGSSVASTGTGMATSSSTGGAMGCLNEANAVTATNLQTTQAGQGDCTPVQVDGFQTGCLGMAATQATCDAWTMDMANAACMDCLLPINMNDDMISPVLLPFTGAMGTLVINNLGACEAAAQNLPACGPPVQDAIYCLVTACGLCSDAETQACQMEAQMGVCAQAFMAIPAMCDPVLNPATPAPECDGADFIETYTNVGNFLCGP